MYVGVNVAIYDPHLRKAPPFESTAKIVMSQRIGQSRENWTFTFKRMCVKKTFPMWSDAHIACAHGDILNFESYAYVYCTSEFKLHVRLLRI